MKKLLFSSMILGMSLFLGVGIHAQNIQSDRPGIGDGASTLEQKSFQLETGFEMAQFQPGKNEAFNSTSLPLVLLRYGISDWAELRLIQSYQFTDRPNLTGNYKLNGFSNISIGTKLKLSDNSSKGVQTAVLLEVVAPTGSADVAADKFLISLRYLHSWDFAAQWNLGSNIGTYWAEEQDLSLTYSFALGYAISESWSVFVEPFGAFFLMNEFNIALDGGVTYLLNNTMQVDFSAGKGINSDYYFFGLGFSWLIGKI
ncbi:MAG: transporter [Bacteroidetes bacterium]|nr:transporter [Bacteroidota bacterium]